MARQESGNRNHNKARYLVHCCLLLEVAVNHEIGSSELKRDVTIIT